MRDSLPGAREPIEDFVWSVDHIDLHSIDANTVAIGDQAFPFIGATSFTGQAGQLNFISNVLSGDVNGDEIGDFHMKVADVSMLAVTDLYL